VPGKLIPDLRDQAEQLGAAALQPRQVTPGEISHARLPSLSDNITQASRAARTNQAPSRLSPAPVPRVGPELGRWSEPARRSRRPMTFRSQYVLPVLAAGLHVLRAAYATTPSMPGGPGGLRRGFLHDYPSRGSTRQLSHRDISR
jgi:hypothetical protein